MPIYEYRCENCGSSLEVFQGINDNPLTECGACHQAALVKLVSAPGFRLKGGGWYETDFKKETDKKKNLAGDSSDNGSKIASSGSSISSSVSESASASSVSAEKTTPVEHSKTTGSQTD